MNIPERLHAAMQAARIPSQAALARISGVPQPTVNRILKGGGARGPESGTVSKLAQACNVRFEWLMSGEGPMNRGVELRGPRTTESGAEVVSLPEQKSAPRGSKTAPEVLAALGLISEREAQVLSWFRMAKEPGKVVIETTARAVEKKQLSIVDDKSQLGVARASDSER